MRVYLSKISKVDVHTMILATAATQIEMDPFLNAVKGLAIQCETVVTGVGPMETALQLTKYLSVNDKPHIVLNFGVAGAYVPNDSRKGAGLLDICIAKMEVFADFGIDMGEEIIPLNQDMCGKITYPLKKEKAVLAESILTQAGYQVKAGVFLTVNCVSGTETRGGALYSVHQGLCENMEGAAVARVCEEFKIPFVEVRCISNMVENRNVASWKIVEAISKAAEVAALLSSKL